MKKQKNQSIINLKTDRINNTAEDNKQNLSNTSIGLNTHGFSDKINGENNSNFNKEDEKNKKLHFFKSYDFFYLYKSIERLLVYIYV